MLQNKNNKSNSNICRDMAGFVDYYILLRKYYITFHEGGVSSNKRIFLTVFL